MEHITVLLNEGVESLNIKKDGIYVDATLGGGGHSSLILKALGPKGHLYCFDQDVYAISVARKRLEEIGNNFTIINSNFAFLKEKLAEVGIQKIDGIIYDLGVSSFQFDDFSRGFSYNNEAKLDMRMDQSASLTAYDIVNEWPYEKIAEIIYRYGEDDFSRKIAQKIVDNRAIKPIVTTIDLVNVIKQALPQKILSQKGHPAKKTFQALRIAVNDELRVFETSLYQAIDMLNADGRVVVISFHSLEDRITKNIFKEKSSVFIPKGVPIISNEVPPLELITKKPVLPTDTEIENNNRSHSAKMRVARRNG